MPAPHSHGACDPCPREQGGGLAWGDALGLGGVKRGVRIRGNFLSDGREGGRFGASPQFHGGCNYATGIGDEIGNGENTAGVHPALGFRCRRDIGALHERALS